MFSVSGPGLTRTSCETLCLNCHEIKLKAKLERVNTDVVLHCPSFHYLASYVFVSFHMMSSPNAYTSPRKSPLGCC